MRRMFSEKQLEEMSKGIAKEVVQNDKDILSQIVYDEENHTITFPKNVLPLRVGNNDEDFYYFDYMNSFILEENGTTDNSFIEFGSDYEVMIDDTPGNIGVIKNMEYILFNCSGNDIPLNSYYLYHPITESGTKLYIHEVWDSSEMHGIRFLSTSQEKIFGNYGVDFSIPTPEIISCTYLDENDGIYYPCQRISWDNSTSEIQVTNGQDDYSFVADITNHYIITSL